eukprot:s910_g15.t1
MPGLHCLTVLLGSFAKPYGPEEVVLLEKWAKSPIADLEAQVAKLTKETEGTLKAGAREKVASELKMLKQILKARKKGEEL